MPAVFAFFFVAMIGGYAVMNVTTRDATRIDAVASVNATYILSYKAALVAYINANPAVTGNITNVALATYWPTGLVAKAGWTNSVNGGVLYVYESSLSAPQSVLDDLYRKTGKSFLVGRSNGATLMSATGVNTGVTIPVLVPAIPTGAIVLVGK